LPSYLELSLDSFARQNDRLKQQFTTMPPGMGMPGLNPAKALGAVPMPSPQFLEDQVRQNMALFDRAMKMFSPFAYAPVDEPRPAAAPEAPQAAPAPSQDPSLGELKKRIEEMQEQIEKLASKS
jgi:polyhydroxyalkanoate synthesis regulator protein